MNKTERFKKIIIAALIVSLGRTSLVHAQTSTAVAKSLKTAPQKSALRSSKAKSSMGSSAEANDLQIPNHSISADVDSLQIASNETPTETLRLAPATQTSVTQLPQPEPLAADGGKRLTVIAAVEYSQQIAKEDQGQRQSSTDWVLALSYKTTDLSTLTAKTALSQENYGQKNSSFSDTQVVVGIKGYTFNDNLVSSHSIAGVIPTSENSQKRDHLQTAVSISNGLTYTLPNITVLYRLGLSKNFHEFNVNADGNPNIEYSLSNIIALDIPVYGDFHVTTQGVYKNSRTYGNFERSSFSFSADLNYNFTSQLAMNIGTSNEGSALKANGVDSNITAYDDKSSILRAGLGYTY